MKKGLFLSLILVLVLLAACGRTNPAAENTPASAATAAPVEETPAPVVIRNEWLEELPWEETWTCLILGWKELEPEESKEALRDLLYAYDWALIDPEAKQPEPLPMARGTAIYLDQVYAGRDTVPIRFWFEKNGDVYWNGTLLRPLGENAGEELLADWKALAGTGINAGSPPDLTLTCGDSSIAALVHGTYSWSHVTRIGEWWGAESDAFCMFYDYDWLGTEAPILRAEGDVILSFASREPDSLGLTVFTSLGQAPVELRDGRFTPYAGVNTYALSAHWDKAEQGGFGSCIYILLVEGDGPALLPEAEDQVSGEILAADAYGCTYTVDNGMEVGLSLPANQTTWGYMGISAYSLFRRTDAGGWAWVQPLRFMESRAGYCPAGERVTLGLDWSYNCGTLEPGEYTLLLSCHTQEKYQSRREYIYLPLGFTLGEESLPVPVGPEGRAEAPAGIGTSVESLSPHRFRQTVSNTGEARYIAERDFALYRREDNGDLTYIPPKYHLSGYLNDGWPVLSGDTSLPVDLAAAYGPLDKGIYVIRRRLYRLEEGENTTWFDRSWRTVPADRVEYLDAAFTLPSYMRAADHGVEPMTYFPYAGEETELPLKVNNPQFRAEGCRFRLENLGDLAVSFDTDSARLYFYSGADWLPLEMARHPGSGLLETVLEPGEGRELSFSFTPAYASLTKGTYRLVLPLSAEGEPAERSWLAVEFTIRADGTGTFNGMLRPAEIALENYRRGLAEKYVWPEDLEVLDSVWNSTGRNWTSDPYTTAWTAERLHGRLRVTVWRDRDVKRVKALLGKFGCVDVVRGEDYERKPSPVKGEMPGTPGVLRAEVLEQEDPDLCREGTWLLSLEVTEEVQVDGDFSLNVWPEVWDPEEGQWYALAEQSQSRLAFGYPTVVLEPGLNPFRVVSLGWYKAEFRPGEQYRFVLLADVQAGSGEKLEYYTCPFTVNDNA